jgi:predicted permease
MTGILSDLRFAFRTLARSPLFTMVAVLSLALGIGANTAIFSLMDQLMLRLLPVRDPESLVMLYQQGAHNGSNMGYRMHSYPIYQDFQAKADPLYDVFCRRLVDAALSVDNATERVSAEMVSGNYFQALGVKPAVGRLLNSEEDDRVHKGHPVVVLSYDYWMNRFGGKQDVIGKKILINNYPMTIVGVSAAGFFGLDPSQSPQIRVPIQMQPVMTPAWTWVHTGDRRTRFVQVFGRLKPGYTLESAMPKLQGLFTQIRQYEMTLPAAKDWSAYNRDQFMKGTIHLERAANGYSNLRRDFSTALWVLMAMVGLVLLIACANVANLMIARAVARQKEVAVRLSLGASRGQLIRQLLVESLLLSTMGAAGGILLATWMTRGLLAMIPSEENALLLTAEPDLRILSFTLGLTLLTALLFGLVPALRASRPDLWSTLKDAVGSIAGSGGSVLLRKGLVASQVALSFLLLFGAGLFVRSLQNLKETNTGFRDIDNLVSFGVDASRAGYGDEQATSFYNTLHDNVQAMPGVKAAGHASVGLLAGDEWDSTMSVEGHKAADGEDMQAFINSLSPGYFDTMGVRVVEGRDFDRRDVREDAKVCIVNRKFATHFFKDKSPIGRHVGWGNTPKTKLDIEIVGVVEDTLYEGPREGVRRQVFIPYWGKNGRVFYARAARQSKDLYGGLRAEVAKLDPRLPVVNMKTLGAQLDQTLLTERLIALLSAGFGLLATLLASIGLYGVMAFVVTRRTKEIGVRMALGATPGSVVWSVMKEVLLLVMIGLAVGVPAAFILGRYVGSQLYGVKAHDPLVASITIVLLLTVAALAGFLPARRASRIDPILALRYE